VSTGESGNIPSNLAKNTGGGGALPLFSELISGSGSDELDVEPDNGAVLTTSRTSTTKTVTTTTRSENSTDPVFIEVFFVHDVPVDGVRCSSCTMDSATAVLGLVGSDVGINC
jgi:hypothetical protein